MGRQMCEVLAEAGHRVVGLDRLDQDRGPLQRVVEADLRDPAVPGQVVADIQATEGRLDVLVHNAAVYVHQHPLPEVSLEDYDLMTAVNLRAVFFLSQAAAEANDPTAGVGSSASRAWVPGQAASRIPRSTTPRRPGLSAS
jgi:NAD(P)-dependent dehydrogenase (short-subunit alcohol dehydrogenase family)